MPKNLIEKLQETLDFVCRRTHGAPKYGIILGSGLGNLVESSREDVVFLYNELPHMVQPTVQGHPGKMVFGTLQDKPVVIMQGRLHYYEGFSMEEITYPVRLMKLLGVEYLLITCAVGSVNPAYRPGDLVFIKDHINNMGRNPLAGPWYPQFGERFCDMNFVYDRDLRKIGLATARRKRFKVHEGIYCAVSGPSYETPSEIRGFQKMGADVVGMSMVPEAMTAHQMGIKLLAISYVSNSAAGIGRKSITHNEVLDAGSRIGEALSVVLTDIIAELP